jgi:peptide/nickel transport system permease protein
MLRQRLTVMVVAFAAVHAILLFAGFFAPYSPVEQHRDFAYAPPARLHMVDHSGHMHFLPFLYRLVSSDADGFQYKEDRSAEHPLRFFVRRSGRAHFFGIDTPATVFILGTDAYGRDIFSRILFGGRVSLAAAAIATVLSLVLGAGLGGISGHFGGATDTWIMRGAELALALPWIYLLLGIRAFLPLHIDARQTFFLISAVIGIMGWARPARLVRGVVLSAKERAFVMAARGFGASEWYLLRRHVLPQALGIVITQAVILVPQFVAAEATLSFLGLGMGEPLPSWGSMLADLQKFQVMSSYWWMAAPIAALVAVSITYFALADALHEGAAAK